jgi:peptidoglycan-associated lipoprotein
MNTTTRVLLAAGLVASLAACNKTTKTTPPPVDTPTETTTQTTTDSCLRQRVVYFDFDQDTLKPEFAAIMACHAKYLQDQPTARITLEGNADERGTREYNRGLGERRGNAVSTALQGNGGSASQLEVVSYGEERPTCTDANESCWAQNRRVEIVYTAK